jgi:signal transduction histidine kinase
VSDVNCIFTKILLPFVQREAGPEAVATLCRAAGRSRDYLMADHNWLPLAQVNALMDLGHELTARAGEDDEAWLRRLWDFSMDWKPREERSYLGTYSMGIGDPRGIYQKQDVFQGQVMRWARLEVLEIGRRHARFRRVPDPGVATPRWACLWMIVSMERFPTNWGLPRARVEEPRCAARGAATCDFEVAWQNPSLGARFWGPLAAGGALAVPVAAGLQAAGGLPAAAQAALALLPVLAGGAVGVGLREAHRRRHTQRLLELQGEEVLYSNNELEKKFRDLETKIEQLSLLMDLSSAVNASLDPETIYAQALERLVHRMGYQRAQLFLVDHARGMLRGHRVVGAEAPDRAAFEALTLPLDPAASAVGRVVATGLPVMVNDVEAPGQPVHLETVRAHAVRSFVAVPLRVKERIFGVLVVVAGATDRFAAADVELVSAVANHVALAVDRAESFRTIEELSRGLEDKVRVRTEQLRGANEELQAAYRDLQATQVQLVQREKMASVGQLVAGVAHELNNPIGFVFSNVSTLEDFVRRLRTMLEAYRALPLPEAERAAIQARWEEQKVDYALRYLDSMIQGIREGAERARKIVRDLRVFARSEDDVWQAVDLHEELESSLTLLNHLLKDHVAVHRKLGPLPPVECVRSQIDQVFLNLLANAAQAIRGEGAITIETRQDGDLAVVAITDTGPGVPPGLVGRIFDPFFTTKPVGEGTGLGLSISYEIVKKHGGELMVTSPPGEGATFTVRIPVARAEAAR